MKLLYTIPQTGDAIAQGRTKIYELIRDGRLEAVKADGRTLITGRSIVAYAESLPSIHQAA